MKKLLFLIALIITTVTAFTQTVPADRVVIRQSLFLRDRWVDSVKNDTVGLINRSRTILTSKAIYDFVVGRINGSVTITDLNNGLKFTGTVGQIGGPLIQYSNITLGNYPLTLINNGVQKSASTDSNMLRFANNNLTTSSADTFITPGIQFLFSGRKTFFGAASTPVSFLIDAYGYQSNPTGGGIFRLRSHRVTNGDSTLFSISEKGVIQQNLNVNGITIGGTSSPGSNFIFAYDNPATMTGSNNVAIGYQALKAHKGGDNNVAIGILSMVNDTSGVNNTAVGRSTLQANTNGTSNTAIGYSALAANKSGSLNTAIGYSALILSDTSNNTAVGYEALFGNTKGVYNVAIGGNSMFSNTIGYQNAVVGFNTLHANTTGIKNAGIGSPIFENSIDASFNSGVGQDGFLHLTHGNENSGTGWLVWPSDSTGSNNSALGSSAGRNIFQGSNNVFLGSESGYLNIAGGNSQASNCTNCIALGYRSLTTGNNQMRLGNTLIDSTYIYGITHNSIPSLTMVLVDTISGLENGHIYHMPLQNRILADFTTDVNNVSTTETDLYTYTTAANTLTSDGEKLVAHFAGTFNDFSSTELYKVYFAGTNIATTTSFSPGVVGSWKIDVTIIKTGSTTARADVSVAGTGINEYFLETDLTGVTFSGTNIIKFSGTCSGGTGGSNDITAKLGFIEWKNKAN